MIPIIGGRRAVNFGAVAQLGERCVRNAEVEGSTPFRSTICKSRRRNSLCELPLPATTIIRTIGDTFRDTFGTLGGTTLGSFPLIDLDARQACPARRTGVPHELP